MCVSFLSCAADVIETVMHSFNWVNHILSSILHIAETHNVRNGETFWSPRQEVEGYNRKWACLVKKNQLTSNMHELLSFTEQTVPSQLHTQHCHIRTLSHTHQFLLLHFRSFRSDSKKTSSPPHCSTGSHVGFIMHTTPVQMSTNKNNSKTHMDNSQKLRIS